jgi:hypothetical protein
MMWEAGSGAAALERTTGKREQYGETLSIIRLAFRGFEIKIIELVLAEEGRGGVS